MIVSNLLFSTQLDTVRHSKTQLTNELVHQILKYITYKNGCLIIILVDASVKLSLVARKNDLALK